VGEVRIVCIKKKPKKKKRKEPIFAGEDRSLRWIAVGRESLWVSEKTANPGVKRGGTCLKEIGRNKTSGINIFV